MWRGYCRNQTKTLLGIETKWMPNSARILLPRRNQTKTLLGIETRVWMGGENATNKGRNQTKTLLGIETRGDTRKVQFS